MIDKTAISDSRITGALELIENYLKFYERGQISKEERNVQISGLLKLIEGYLK